MVEYWGFVDSSLGFYAIHVPIPAWSSFEVPLTNPYLMVDALFKTITYANNNLSCAEVRIAKCKSLPRYPNCLPGLEQLVQLAILSFTYSQSRAGSS